MVNEAVSGCFYHFVNKIQLSWVEDNWAKDARLDAYHLSTEAWPTYGTHVILPCACESSYGFADKFAQFLVTAEPILSTDCWQAEIEWRRKQIFAGRSVDGNEMCRDFCSESLWWVGVIFVPVHVSTVLAGYQDGHLACEKLIPAVITASLWSLSGSSD